jgi:hypothetical protein
MSNTTFLIIMVVVTIVVIAAAYFHTPAGQSVHDFISSIHGR